MKCTVSKMYNWNWKIKINKCLVKVTSKHVSTSFIVKFRAPKISLQLTTIGEVGFSQFAKVPMKILWFLRNQSFINQVIETNSFKSKTEKNAFQFFHNKKDKWLLEVRYILIYLLWDFLKTWVTMTFKSLQWSWLYLVWLQDQLRGGRALDVFRRPRLVSYGSVQPVGHLWTPLPLQNRDLEYILHVCKKLVLKKKWGYLSELAINGRECLLL